MNLRARVVLLAGVVTLLSVRMAAAEQVADMLTGGGDRPEAQISRFPAGSSSTASLQWGGRYETCRLFAPPNADAPSADAPSPDMAGRSSPTVVDTPPSSASAGPASGDFAPKEASSGPFHINITAGPLLSANLEALSAFDRAAAQWERRISDPVTVNVQADLKNLGSPTIIGQTYTVLLYGDYDLIRDQMVADAADEPDDAIVAALPTAEQFSAFVPDGLTLDGYLAGSKASLKAVGFEDLDVLFKENDATITFNSGFAFDYDNRDGVGPGKMDFETVAAHELGHALGFLSAVSTVDVLLHYGLTSEVTLDMLDLFRFEDDGERDPSDLSEFSTYPRSLVPDSPDITDQVLAPWGALNGAELRMSTGSYEGDGRQASHWKDDSLTGRLIGIMDPTLAYGTAVPVDESDLRALDLLGYEIHSVPEPGALSLLAAALCSCAALLWRHNGSVRAA